MYGVKSLTIDIYIGIIIKAVPKVIGDWFWKPIMFKSLIKTGFSIRNILFTICIVRIWIVTGYFLFEKQDLIELFKVIGVQKSIKKGTS